VGGGGGMHFCLLGFEVLTVVDVEIKFFRDVMPCSLVSDELYLAVFS
jgi:hypothetical protein